MGKLSEYIRTGGVNEYHGILNEFRRVEIKEFAQQKNLSEEFVSKNYEELITRPRNIERLSEKLKMSEDYVSRNYSELLKQDELEFELDWKYRHECNIFTAPWGYKSYYLPSFVDAFAIFVWVVLIIFCIWKPLKYKNKGIKRLAIVLSPVAFLACSLVFEELRVFGEDFMGDNGLIILAMILVGFPSVLLTLIDIISFSIRWIKKGFDEQKPGP